MKDQEITLETIEEFFNRVSGNKIVRTRRHCGMFGTYTEVWRANKSKSIDHVYIDYSQKNIKGFDEWLKDINLKELECKQDNERIEK